MNVIYIFDLEKKKKKKKKKQKKNTPKNTTQIHKPTHPLPNSPPRGFYII